MAFRAPRGGPQGSPFSIIFQLKKRFISTKCRQISVLGLTRGSLGS
jgi:hypothetical protein